MRSLFRVLQDYGPQGVVLGGGGTVLPVDRGSLPPFLALAGDQVVSLSAGTYNGAGSSVAASPSGAAHAHTAGIYGGWLVVDGQNTATIDLSATALILVATGLTDLRLLFVRCHFVNGMIDTALVRYMRFWHCTFTFPIAEWMRQYATFNGGVAPLKGGILDASVLDAMPNYTAAAVRGGYASTNGMRNFEFYGCDFAHVGDDGISSGNFPQGIVVRGCKFWDMSDHNRAFIRPEGTGTYQHADSIQTNFGGIGLVVHDSWVGGHFNCQTGASNDGPFTTLSGVDIDNIWSAGCASTAGSFADDPTHYLVGTISNFHFFGNAQYQTETGGTDSPTNPNDLFWEHITLNDTTHNRSTDAGQLVVSGGTGIWGLDGSGSLPSGVTIDPVTHILGDLASVGSALSVDFPSIENHASNPAVVWRNTAGQGATDWATFFSGNWP